jgi:hypothetical protein
MRHALSLAGLFAAMPACAQITDEQLWLQTNASTRIAERTRITLEGIARFGDTADGLGHVEIGGLVTHAPTRRIELAAGYRHVQDYDHARRIPNEERLRQMITLRWAGVLTTRLRFEQRFSSAGGEVAFRLRPRLGLELPLREGGPVAFATQEHFLNFNGTDWGVIAGYERVRHTLGLTVPLTEGVKADIGYLNEYRFGRDGARDRMAHAATLAVNLEL